MSPVCASMDLLPELLLIANRETSLMFQVLLVHASPFVFNKLFFCATNDPRAMGSIPRVTLASSPASGQKVLSFKWRRHFHNQMSSWLMLISLHGREEVTLRIDVTDMRNLPSRISIPYLSMCCPEIADWRVGGSDKGTRRESSVTRGVGSRSRKSLHGSFNLMTRTEELVSCNAVWVRSTEHFQIDPTSCLSPSFISSYGIRSTSYRFSCHL